MENLAYQDDAVYELIDGETVLMSPRPAVNHNRVVTNISAIFRAYLKGKRCEVFGDGVEVHLDEKNIFVPDVMIVCRPEIVKYNGIYGAPDLVVEVSSPSTARRDATTKRLAYAKAGVREYWLVSPIGQSIEVFLLKEGNLELSNVYNVFPDLEWARMNEEERAAAQLAVKVSLYDDLYVDVREVFDRVESYF